jgi:hypothetical protein
MTTADVFSTHGPAAYRHSSFDPDRRWQRDKAEFELDVATLLEKYTPLATTDDQRAILNAELERYMANYQKHYAGIYGAGSRTASVMITGASNFPTRRNQKWLDIEMRRVNEFLDWREKAQAAIKRAILDARTPEQKSDAMTSTLIRWAREQIDTLNKIAAAERGDPGVPSWYAAMDKSAFTTSFTGKLHREVKNGNLAEVQACLRWLDDQQQIMPKPLITKRNSVWAYLDQKPAEPTPTRENVVIYAADGVTVTANHELGRFQIEHDEKPDAETRATLKRHGWKWSPQHTAWQRQLTNSTRYNLSQLFPALAK